MLRRFFVALYDERVARPYGKIKRRLDRMPPPKNPGGDAFKIKFIGKDGTPLSMADMQQGLLELARKLRAHDALRIKRATRLRPTRTPYASRSSACTRRAP